MNHTPTPWRNHESQVYFPNMAGGFSLSNCPDAEANASRIVACVNACEGISTDDLERHYNTGGGVDQALDEVSLRDHVNATQQRAELLRHFRECQKSARLMHDQYQQEVIVIEPHIWKALLLTINEYRDV